MFNGLRENAENKQNGKYKTNSFIASIWGTTVQEEEKRKTIRKKGKGEEKEKKGIFFDPFLYHHGLWMLMPNT